MELALLLGCIPDARGVEMTTKLEMHDSSQTFVLSGIISIPYSVIELI